MVIVLWQSVRGFSRQEKIWFHSIKPIWQQACLELYWLNIIMYRVDFNLGTIVQLSNA